LLITYTIKNLYQTYTAYHNGTYYLQNLFQHLHPHFYLAVTVQEILLARRDSWLNCLLLLHLVVQGHAAGTWSSLLYGPYRQEALPETAEVSLLWDLDLPTYASTLT